MTSEKFISDQHQHMWTNLAFAEQKTGWGFALASGLLVYLHSQKVTTSWLHNICGWRFSEYSAFLSTFGLLGCCFLLLFAVVPRLAGDAKGLVYWRAVAKCGSAEAYINAVKHSGEAGLEAELAKHIFELSVICQKKYFWMRLGMWVGTVGTVAALINLAFVKH